MKWLYPSLAGGNRREPSIRLLHILATVFTAIGMAAAQAQVPYAADPAFHGGQYIEDAFYANQNGANQYFEGKKVVRLGNGDIVAAALVKNPNGNQTNGLWNIGLVRYNAAGTRRLTWSNGGAHAHANGEYIVYPKSNTAYYDWIQDIVAIDGKIIVAANYHFNGGNDIDTHLLVFGEDGSFKGYAAAFNSGAQKEYVGGMAAYSTSNLLTGTTTHSVVVVATEEPIGGGIGRPIFRRYTLSAGGSLTGGTGRVNLDTHWCDNSNRDCRPAGIALASRGIGVAPAIYIVNRYYHPTAAEQGWSIAVTRVNSSGVADSGWPGWWYTRDGGSAGPHRNYPVAIAVRTTGLGLPTNPYRDTVFVASEVDRSCGNGVLVSRFDHQNAYTGSQILGGSSASTVLCAANGRPTDWPVDMTISGDRLAVVGYGKYTPLAVGGNPVADVYDGFVAILDASATTGALPLLDLRDYRYPISGTAGFRHTALWGIVPTTTNKFVVVGDNRFPNDSSVAASLRGKSSVALLGIAPAAVSPPSRTATLRFDSASGPTTKTIVRNSGTAVTFAWTTQNLPAGTTCKIQLRPNDSYNAAASPVSGGTRTDGNIHAWGAGQKPFYLRCSDGTISPDITLTIDNAATPVGSAKLRFDSANGPTAKAIVRNSGTPVTFAWSTQGLPSGTTCKILLRPDDGYNAAASPVSGGTRTDGNIHAWGVGAKVFYLRCSNGTTSPDITLDIVTSANGNLPVATLRFDSAGGPATKTIVRNSGTPVTFAWTTQNLPSGTTCKILLRPNDAYNGAASPVSGGTRTDANIHGWGAGQKVFYLRCTNGSTSPDITLTINPENAGTNPVPAHFRGTNLAGMTLGYQDCLKSGGPIPGVNFANHDTRLIDYYANKGMKAIRFMFTWECVQPVLNGPIPAAGSNYQSYFNNMKAMVDYATNVKGMHVVIAPWQGNISGGVGGAMYGGKLIGSAEVPVSAFANFWNRMATVYKNNPRVGYSLVNEPNGMSTMAWFSAAQAAITGIRNAGSTQRIYVPGNGYSAASAWEMNYYDTAATRRSNAYGWLNANGAGQRLSDPTNNLAIEVHTYLDSDQSGHGDDIAHSASSTVNATVAWARANGVKVYLGEIGIHAGTAGATAAWQNFVNYANANTDTLIGFTWWAGGYPGWWNDLHGPYFSITPTNANFTGDTINMTMIQGAFQ